MAIVFESERDPYGILAASSVLGNALMQRGQQNLALQQQQQKFDEQNLLKKQQGGILAESLKTFQDQNKPYGERVAAMQNYISQTGDTSVLPMLKDLGKQEQQRQTLISAGLYDPLSQSGFQQDTSQPSPSASQQSQSRLQNLSEDQLIALAASGDNTLKTLADMEFKRRDLTQKKFESDRKFNTQQTQKFADSFDQKRQDLIKKKQALSEVKNAISQDNTGAFSRNNLARIFNRPELITASGAQLVGAGKELLISNLGTISGRPNQFLEQQLTLALPELGKSREANMVLAESLSASAELDQAGIDLWDQLVSEDMQKYGYRGADIQQRWSRGMKDVANEIQDKYAYRTRQLIEQEKGDKWLIDNVSKKVPEGTPLTLEMGKAFLMKYKDVNTAIENAKKQGYTIYSIDRVQEFTRG